MTFSFHVPFLLIQLILMTLTIVGCVMAYAFIRYVWKSQYICYSCKHFSQTYMKPVETTKWLGKVEPMVCKECGTTYTYKYWKVLYKYPRYYRIPGFKRVTIDYSE